MRYPVIVVSLLILLACAGPTPQPEMPEVEPSVREQLAAMGHEIKVRNIGNAHALAIEYDENGRPVRFTGASDRRGAGLALGL